MGAALKSASAMPRSGVQGHPGGKSRSGHKNGPPEQKPSTMRLGGRCLIAADDIRAAIAWRLSGIPELEVDTLAEALRPFAKDFREARPEVAEILADLRRPGDRRSPWSLACAALARDAFLRGDQFRFAMAGFAVVEAERQGRRGAHVREHTRDALDALIARHKAAHPGDDADTAFARFGADANAEHEVLAELDANANALVCALGPGGALRNVGREEFRRRFRRA